MFGISLTEVALIALVALVVVGPEKLPKMLRTLGDWIRKIRQMTTDVRAQTGIDDILREEGIEGGLAELRSLARGDLGALGRSRPRPDQPDDDPYVRAEEIDRYREYPPEGVDAAGALPDDLVDEPEEADANAALESEQSSLEERSDEEGEGAKRPKSEAMKRGGGTEPRSSERDGAPIYEEVGEQSPAEGDEARPKVETSSTRGGGSEPES